MALIPWHNAPKHKGILPSILLGIFVLVATLIIAGGAPADFATPFVEINNKVGDVSEGHGYVVALGHKVEDSKYYLVLVMTDTMEHIVISATAEKGVVKESLVGRPVLIRAEVIERGSNRLASQSGVHLKILSMRSSEKQ